MMTNLTNFSLTSLGKVQQRAMRASFGYALWMLVLLLGGGAFEVRADMAYIASLGSNNVSVIDTNTNTVVSNIPVGGISHSVAASSDGARVYVTKHSSNAVSVIDTGSNTVVATVPVGTDPRGVAVTPNGSRAYVANHGINNVSVIDTSTNSVVATVGVGSGPYGVAINLFGTRVYVTNENSDSVSVIDTSNNTVVTTVPVGDTPIGVTVNPTMGRVYVANAGTNNVSVIDTSTNTVVTSVTVGSTPIGMAVNPSGTRLYVANRDSNSVSVIDTNTNTVVTTVTVGNLPHGVAIDLAGTRVYVANYSSHSVSVINTSNNSVTNVAVGTNPVAIGQFIRPVTGCNAVTEIPVAECQALSNLYNSTNGPNWTNKTGWNETNTPCSWFGVSCGSGHVMQLDLNGNWLSGPLPDFSNLPGLTVLYLYNNQLSGSIPNFNLPNLTELSLADNQLDGSLPNFSNLPGLMGLHLSGNQLSGPIPDFSNRPNLTYLYLMNNQLSGPLPNFNNLPELAFLYLDHNQLSGPIPNFSNLPNLTGLLLYENQLSGPIPEFSNLPNLTFLFLMNNHLNGTIPNLDWSSFNLFSLTNNCGLIAYDAAQETVLNDKDPNWQTQNPSCPVVTLTITKTGNGTITSTPAGINCGISCVASYDLNANVQLTATAEAGYIFSQWSGDCAGTTATTTVTMDAAKNCTATFVPVVETNLELTLTPAPILTDSQMGTTHLDIIIKGCSESIYWKAEPKTGGYITNLLVTPTEGNGNATVTLSYRKPSVMSPPKGNAKIIVTADCGTATRVKKTVNIR